MIRVRNPQDVAAGLFFILVGVAAFTLIWDLPMGRPVRMGPGYIPTMLGYILVFLGAIIAGKGLMADGPGLASWALKPLGLLVGAILVFAFMIEPAGLVLTSIALILVCSIAAPDMRMVETGIFAVALAVASTLLFKTLLQLPMSVWPQ
jgi:hypothetical protein